MRDNRAEKDWGTPAYPISDKDPRGFNDVFPTETRGDGKLRENNVHTGAAQGKGGWKKKVRCQQCGFLVNLNTVDYGGGSLDGAGAGGNIVQTADVGQLNTVDTLTGAMNTTDSGMKDDVGNSETHKIGTQAFKKGSGCPFCFSKNSTKNRNFIQSPTPRPSVGF